jgi:hypothetical protein
MLCLTDNPPVDARKKRLHGEGLCPCSLAEEETRIIAKPRPAVNLALMLYQFLPGKPGHRRPQTACGRQCPWEPTALHRNIVNDLRSSITVTRRLQRTSKAKWVPGLDAILEIPGRRE